MLTGVLCTSSEEVCVLFASESNLFSERDLACHRTSHLVLKQGSAYLFEKCYNTFFICYNKMKNFECVDDNINLKKLLAMTWFRIVRL